MSATVPLLDELMTALAAPTPAQMQELADLGVPMATTIMVGVTKVRPSGSLYEPDPDGTAAWIVPCMDGGDTVDLLAFKSDEPGRWWLRLGACPLLGADALNDLWLGQRLRIHRTPLGWLAGTDAAGVVVLRWTEALQHLVSVPTIEVEDEAHAAEIRRRMVSTITLPEIEVASPARRSAA